MQLHALATHISFPSWSFPDKVNNYNYKLSAKCIPRKYKNEHTYYAENYENAKKHNKQILEHNIPNPNVNSKTTRQILTASRNKFDHSINLHYVHAPWDLHFWVKQAYILFQILSSHCIIQVQRCLDVFDWNCAGY